MMPASARPSGSAAVSSVPRLGRLLLHFTLACLPAVPAVAGPAPAEDAAFDFHAHGPYREGLPRPAELLGYTPGDVLTDTRGLDRVIDAYAAGSDRVRVFELGLTPQRRPLRLLALSSPANLARLDEIQAGLARLADVRTPLDAAAVERLVGSLPAVLWLSYGIHGDETASPEAALHLLHHLAASEHPQVREQLDRLVVLMVPQVNPDGHERYLNYANVFGRGDPEPAAFEHDTPWTAIGRYNQRYFDLNRDAFITSQPESRLLTEAFRRWRPLVSLDHHGETPEFFFPPHPAPHNPNFPLAWQEGWADRFGRGFAGAFDRHRWSYAIREPLETFAPVYWDGWPQYQGTVALIFETDGGGSQGQRMRRADGSFSTMQRAIAKLFVGDLSLLQTASEQREALLRDYRRYAAGTADWARSSPWQQAILPLGDDPGRTAELVATLLRQGIEVDWHEGPFSVGRAHPYLGGTASRRRFEQGAFVVSVRQPRGRLARAILEPHTPVDAETRRLMDEVRRRNAARGDGEAREDVEIYDFMAWSLPLAHGVEAWWSAEPAPAGGRRLEDIDARRMVLAGAPARPLADAPAPATAGAAYLVASSTDAEKRLLLQLLREGYRGSVSFRPLALAGREHAPGAVVFRRGRNPASLDARIAELARSAGVAVHALDTLYQDHGRDGGAAGFHLPLRAPRIAVLAGEPIAPTAYGSLAWWLERTAATPFTALAAGVLDRPVLAGYDVLLLADVDDAGALARALAGDRAAALRQWTADGGVLVCLARSCGALSELGLLGAKPLRLKSAAGGERMPAPVPGSFLRVDVARGHFLTANLGRERIAVHVATDQFFPASAHGATPLRYPAEGPLLVSGLLWEDEAEPLLHGGAALLDEPLERGRVIAFQSQPGLRDLYHGQTPLLLNALLFAPALGGGSPQF